MKQPSNLSEEQIIQIAHEYADKGPRLLARELKCDALVVSGVVTKLRKRGIHIAHRHNFGFSPTLEDAVRKLKAEQQEPHETKTP